MPRTPAQALARAKATTKVSPGMCLKVTRGWYGVAAKYPHAARAWSATRHRHSSTPPAGAPVWWTGGSRGYGHVAISDGGGYVISTDVPSAGRVGRVRITDLTRRWGLQYRGWSNDLNGVIVYPIKPEPPTTPRPPSGGAKVNLTKLRKAARTDPPRASSKAAYPSGTKVIERALVAERLLPATYRDGVGHFGSETVKAYAAWQRRLGYAGDDADGIPGRKSLTELGRRHGFTVA